MSARARPSCCASLFWLNISPIEVTISVGKARPLVSELVELRRDSVLTLDSSIDDPVELYIGDRLIARGELQELGDESGRLGVRLTEVADLSNDV